MLEKEDRKSHVEIILPKYEIGFSLGPATPWPIQCLIPACSPKGSQQFLEIEFAQPLREVTSYNHPKVRWKPYAHPQRVMKPSSFWFEDALSVCSFGISPGANLSSGTCCLILRKLTKYLYRILKDILPGKYPMAV